MKTFNLPFNVLLAALCTAALAHSAQANDAKSTTAATKISVNGMVCNFCAQGIEKRLTAMPQTKEVYIDLKQKIVVAQAKDGQPYDNAKLKSEIEDAGYEVVKIEPAKESFAAVREQLKQSAKK
jgi:copper chaperone CopZ